MTSSNKKVVVITGPTAVGKTMVAIKVAQHFKTEILSADSRQFFKEISIGTAKPTIDELRQVPHHFVDFISINDTISAGEFEKIALRKIEQLHKKNDVVILTGGSGLYIDAVTTGIDEFPTISKNTKQKVRYWLKEDFVKLQQFIKEKDPEQFKNMDTQNPMRISRVAEVILESGKPYSSFLKGNKPKRPFEVITFCLTMKREKLYHRINKRVDKMLALGLEEEAKNVYPQKYLQALNTVGYKELFNYFEGNLTKAEAIEKIKQHTRNYAKRQLTWFKKKSDAYWVENEDSQKTANEIIKRISA